MQFLTQRDQLNRKACTESDKDSVQYWNQESNETFDMASEETE